MKDLNWDIISEVSRSVAKRAVKTKQARDTDEVQSEIIAFIVSGTHDGNALLRYCQGEDTEEKRNKLAFSLLTNRTWLHGLFNNSFEDNDYMGGNYIFENADELTIVYKAGRYLKKAEIVNILKASYSETCEMSERHAIILDALNSMNPKKKKTLELSYGGGLSVAQGAEIMGFSPQRFSYLRKQALDELGKVLIPDFISKNFAS